jgi:peptide/nickel transport system ATP-binding protein
VAGPAVNDVSFDIMRGETLGLVGESGSGKSTIGRAITMLAPPDRGAVTFDGVDLTELSARPLRRIRKRFQVVFQDPYASLSPRMRVGEFIAEPLHIHKAGRSRSDIADRVSELLTMVGLDPAFSRRYPHQFSGGQRQRLCIARAIALSPDFVVADEPISALDVSIQAQVITLLQTLQRELSLTFLFISHDLSIVRHICHRTAVLYQGRIVELAPTETLFGDARHPYTKILLSAIPIPNPKLERSRKHLFMDPDFDYSEPESSLVEVAPGHWLASSRA